MVAQQFIANRQVLEVPGDIPVKGYASGIATAFEKGARAAARGTSRKRCPYASGRGAAKFRKAWFRGFDTYLQTVARSKAKASASQID